MPHARRWWPPRRCYVSQRGREAFFTNCNKINCEIMKIRSKMHAKSIVMWNWASQEGHFPLSRRKLSFFERHRAEIPPEKWWFWSQFGYGNMVLHTILANIVLRKCASYRGRGAHVHKIRKKMKKKHANKHQKSNFLKHVTEIAKMNCKLWLKNGLKSKKCSRPSREQHFFWFLVAEEGPTEGDWKG